MDAPASVPSFTDDKTPICTSFILNLVQSLTTTTAAGAAPAPPSTSSQQPPRPPIIIGLNGLQGVGKTTLVTSLASTLTSSSGLRTLVLSIDDFYLRHDDQLRLAASHPRNALVQHRGQPSTHDLDLALSVFRALLDGRETSVPSFDKAAFSGRGDRRPESEWLPVNRPGEPPVQAVILEGWCVGFRALAEDAVRARWESESLTLRQHTLEDLLFVNDNLRRYDALTALFDAFIHIDADDLSYVYAWRREQEVALRAEKGTGMTDEQVVKFVDAYFPAYELYCDGVRAGVLPDKPRHQLRIVVGRDRKVKEVQIF